MKSYLKNLKYFLSYSCLKSFIKWTNQQNGLLSFYERYTHIPKKICDYDLRPSNIVCSDFGLLIQGPIWSEDSFTIDSLTLYRHWYPNIPIVLSVWALPNNATLKSLGKLNIHVEVVEKSNSNFNNSSKYI